MTPSAREPGTEPVLFAASGVPGAILLVLGMAIAALLAIVPWLDSLLRAMFGIVAIAAPFFLRDAGMSYECTATTLHARWLWRPWRSYPLSAVSSVTGHVGGTVRVKLDGIATFHLDTRYDDQRTLAEHLRSHLHGPRPALEERPGEAGRVVIDRLAGLPGDRCLVCGSTEAVALTPVEAHKGVDLLLFKYWVTRAFDFPACRRHRWSRWILRVAIWHVVPIGTLVGGLLLFDAIGDGLGGWRLGIPLLATIFVLVVLGNGVARWLADSAVLGVRLGWLSADSTTARIAFSDPEVEAKIRAHLEGR